MSEKTPKSNPAEELLNQFDDNKAQNQIDEYWNEQLGDAGTTDFSDEARKRLEEVKKYHEHLEKLSNQEAESDEDYYNRLIADEQSFEADRLIAADPRLRWLDMMAKDIAKRRKKGGERNEAYIKDQEQKLQDLMSELADVDGIDEGVLLQIVDRTVDTSPTNEPSVAQPGAEAETVGNTREEQTRASASDHADAAAEAASQADDTPPLFGRNARHEANAQKPVAPEIEDATTAHTPEAHAAAAAEAQSAAKVDEAPATPEAKQDSDDITEAIDEVVETIAGDGQESDAEQEDKVETRRARQGKKLANWVMKKLNRAKQIYKYSARAKNVKNIQQKAQNPSRMDSLIAASEQIAAEKSEDENYAPLTKKDFNFRSRHGIGKRAKERDPIYEEAARRLDGVAENEDEIQTEPMTNVDDGKAESHMDTQDTEVLDTARLPAAPTAGEVLRQQREQNPDRDYTLGSETEVSSDERLFESKPGEIVALLPTEVANVKENNDSTFTIPNYEGRWSRLEGTDKFERLPDEENNESAA